MTYRQALNTPFELAQDAWAPALLRGDEFFRGPRGPVPGRYLWPSDWRAWNPANDWASVPEALWIDGPRQTGVVDVPAATELDAYNWGGAVMPLPADVDAYTLVSRLTSEHYYADPRLSFFGSIPRPQYLLQGGIALFLTDPIANPLTAPFIVAGFQTGFGGQAFTQVLSALNLELWDNWQTQNAILAATASTTPTSAMFAYPPTIMVGVEFGEAGAWTLTFDISADGWSIQRVVSLPQAAPRPVAYGAIATGSSPVEGDLWVAAPCRALFDYVRLYRGVRSGGGVAYLR